MSTTTRRVPRTEALDAASRFRALFDGTFDRWEFAGSLRRQCPTVGDIEHVLIGLSAAPAWPSEQVLFEGAIEPPCPQPMVPQRAMQLIENGTLTLARYGESGTTRCGDRYIGLMFEGVKHELFIATPENWGLILAIRTGSADFSRELVTALRPRGFKADGGRLMRRTRGPGEEWETIQAPDEATVFEAAGLPITPPEKR